MIFPTVIAIVLGFNLWGQGVVPRKCTPRKTGTVLAPCWNLAGPLLEPSWNLAGTLLAALLEPCWNLPGTLLEPCLQPCWNLAGTFVEPCWNLACNLPWTFLEPCWNLACNLAGTFLNRLSSYMLDNTVGLLIRHSDKRIWEMECWSYANLLNLMNSIHPDKTWIVCTCVRSRDVSSLKQYLTYVSFHIRCTGSIDPTQTPSKSFEHTIQFDGTNCECYYYLSFDFYCCPYQTRMKNVRFKSNFIWRVRYNGHRPCMR